VISTFAMYYRTPRAPSLCDQEIIRQITHLAGVAIQRKLTEEKLRRSEAYLAEAQRWAHTGSWALDTTTRKYVYWSEEMFRIWGFDPQQGPPDGRSLVQRMHPADRDRMVEYYRKAKREKRDYGAEFRIVLPDGTVRHIQGVAHPVLSASGELVELVGTHIDITERKGAEEALRAAETRFRTFVDHASDALFVHGEEAKIVDVNRQACESLGYTREELIGMTAHEFDSAADAAFIRYLGERLDAGEICTFEASHRRKDGTVFPVEVRMRPFWHAGHWFGLALARDITESKRAEEERERLRQMEADLAHINRVSMMGELAASLTHDIRQPITAAATNAKTCLRWLQRDPPDMEEACETVSRIVKDVNRAAEIINRVRALYRREAQQRELVDVNDLIEEMIVLLRNEASRYSIAMQNDLARNLPRVMADRVQLQQVFMNLVLNGIEAMKDSTGELTIKSEQTGDGQVLISVSDSGVGLPCEKVEQIFNAFFTTKPQGTGMGLTITRSIVEAHGGRLWATANSGRGATFHFTLPAEAKAAEMQPTGT
jgi:PAS domain S-box-containing protein